MFRLSSRGNHHSVTRILTLALVCTLIVIGTLLARTALGMSPLLSQPDSNGLVSGFQFATDSGLVTNIQDPELKQEYLSVRDAQLSLTNASSRHPLGDR